MPLLIRLSFRWPTPSFRRKDGTVDFNDSSSWTLKETTLTEYYQEQAAKDDITAGQEENTDNTDTTDENADNTDANTDTAATTPTIPTHRQTTQRKQPTTLTTLTTRQITRMFRQTTLPMKTQPADSADIEQPEQKTVL